MTNYFSIPRFFFKEENIKAERNPKFCDNVKQISSSSSETKLEFVERSHSLPTFTEEELKSERWIKIEEGQKMDYFISNLGRIYSAYSGKILRPILSPSHKRLGMSPSIHLCGFPTDENANTWREKNGSRMVSISSLMCKYFFGISYRNTNNHKSYLIDDSGVRQCYVIHKNNNPFDNRKSNLFVTHRQTLINYVRSSFKAEEEMKYKSGGIFLIRDEYVNKFLTKLEKKKQSSISILHKEDEFIIITSPDENSLRNHLFLKCQSDLSKEYLRASYTVSPDLSLCNSKKGKEMVSFLRNSVIEEFNKYSTNNKY